MHNRRSILVQPSKLKADVSYWCDRLERHQALAKVHSLVIQEFCVSEWAGHPMLGDMPAVEHMNLLDDDDVFLDLPELSLYMPVALKYAHHSTEDKGMAPWECLAEFVARLPALSDLYYDLSKTPPNCVLQAVQRSQSQLHLSRLWFCDYLRYENRAPTELCVLRSPGLRGITARSCGYDINGGEDYTHEAILSLVNESNSEIEHLSLLTDHEGLAQNMFYSLQDHYPRRPWPGFNDSKGIPSGHRANLKSFELGGAGYVRMDLLETSFRKCNMSALTTLKLRIPSSHRGFRWLATQVKLPSLTTLVLGETDDGAKLRFDGCGNRNPVSEFLASLPPLKVIRFIGDIDQTSLDVTMQVHGQSLKRLWFPHPRERCKTFFDPTRVRSIESNCPMLEDLSLSIPRSFGDMREVEMYRALGGLPRLQRLAIALDCEDTSLHARDEDDCDPTPIYPDFDGLDEEGAGGQLARTMGFGRRVWKGHIRRAIQNSALDEGLARSIFATIRESKPRGDDILPLQRLELRPVRGIYTAESRDTIEEVGRWWLLRKEQLYSSNVIATELRCPADLDEERYGRRAGEDDLDSGMKAIYRKIWPSASSLSAANNGNLAWKAFPLATEPFSSDKHPNVS